MVVGSAVNYIIGTIGLVSFMFNIGPIDDSIYAYNGQPWVAVIYRITGSKAARIAMIILVAINVCKCSCFGLSDLQHIDTGLQFSCLQINMVMTSSRQLWAFARDKGLPFHRWIAKVEENGLPRNAVVVTLVFTALLSLIIIGSAAAFNVILSFGNSGIYSSYIIILCRIIWRRYDKSKSRTTSTCLRNLLTISSRHRVSANKV